MRGAEGGRLSAVQLQRDEWSRVSREVTMARPQSRPSVQTIHAEHESEICKHSRKLYGRECYCLLHITSQVLYAREFSCHSALHSPPHHDRHDRPLATLTLLPLFSHGQN